MIGATHFCSACNADLPVTLFFRRANGKPRTPCKACHKKRARRYRATHLEQSQRTERARVDRNRARVRECNRRRMGAKYRKLHEFLDQIKLSRGCADCGYNKTAVALEFDHLPGMKRLALAHLITRAPAQETLDRELSVCEVRCVICHRIKTDRERVRSSTSRTATYLRKRQMVTDAKNKPCRICGCQYPAAAMDLHHIDPDTKFKGKKRSISVYLFSEKALREEILKCQVLCARCHREVHDGWHSGFLVVDHWDTPDLGGVSRQLDLF